MGFFRFWLECARRAARVSLRQTDRLDLFVSVGVTGIAAMLGWQIDWNIPWPVVVLCLLVAVFLGRLLLVAPYQMWRERNDEARDSRDLLASFKAGRDESFLALAKLRTAGVAIRNAALHPFDTNDALLAWERSVSDWERDVIAELNKISRARGEMFGVLDTVGPARVRSAATDVRHLTIYNQHDCRLARLSELVDGLAHRG